MAGTWGSSWKTSWLTSWNRTIVTPPVVTPAAEVGGTGKRRLPRNYWTIRGKTYLLEDKDVPDLVQAILKTDREKEKKLAPPVRKQIKQIRASVEAPPVATPTFQSLPAFDALWSELMQNKQHAEAEQLRKIAHDMEIEQDDEEIFALLRMVDDT